MESSRCIGFRSKPFITYVWIAKAVEDGFLCQRQLDAIVSDQKKLYMKTVFADLKASSLSFLLENICSSSNASCSQTSICGSKNISDANLESFSLNQLSYMGMESKALNMGLNVRSCIGHAFHQLYCYDLAKLEIQS